MRQSDSQGKEGEERVKRKTSENKDESALKILSRTHIFLVDCNCSLMLRAINKRGEKVNECEEES